MDIKYKQFVIVPKSLRMSPGKIASQVAHATFLALEKENKGKIEIWKYSGMCVIVLKCKTPEQLISTEKYLNHWGIPCHVYIDEGLTEVETMTPTALATGILSEDQFWMLSQFRLYR